ncbi:hypothetical protein ACFFX0_14975 [Citricoccus parietis]|uniref:Uncharacterized protein n=1 Tax=Citricoccus parietis TaxID=592307 RepID=A0ABV5G0F8_9MICC
MAVPAAAAPGLHRRFPHDRPADLLPGPGAEPAPLRPRVPRTRPAVRDPLRPRHPRRAAGRQWVRALVRRLLGRRHGAGRRRGRGVPATGADRLRDHPDAHGPVGAEPHLPAPDEVEAVPRGRDVRPAAARAPDPRVPGVPPVRDPASGPGPRRRDDRCGRLRPARGNPPVPPSAPRRVGHLTVTS